MGLPQIPCPAHLVAMNAVLKIEQLRRALGLDQAELESMTGLARGRISKWASGQGEPTIRQAHRLAAALGTSVDYLADESATEPVARPSVDPKIAGILEIVHELGPDIARRRLLMAGDSRALPGQSYAEIKAAEEAAAAKVPRLKRS